MSETNKALVLRYYEEVYNRGNFDVADEVLHPNYVEHSLHHDPAPYELATSPADIKQHAARIRTTYPDLHYTIEKIIAEGDLVMVSGTVRGTHAPPKGEARSGVRQMTFTSIHILRIERGMIVEDWNLWDSLGAWQQFGMVPSTTELLAAATRRKG